MGLTLEFFLFLTQFELMKKYDGGRKSFYTSSRIKTSMKNIIILAPGIKLVTASSEEVRDFETLSD